MSVVSLAPPLPLPAPPYDASVRLDGWTLDLDVRQIQNTRQWRLASGVQRSIIARMYLEAWVALPIGALPADPDELAGIMEGDPKWFREHWNVITEGWEQKSDGNLYSPILTKLVLSALERRAKAAQRKNGKKKKSENGTFGDQTELALPLCSEGPTPKTPATAPDYKELPNRARDSHALLGLGLGLKKPPKAAVNLSNEKFTSDNPIGIVQGDSAESGAAPRAAKRAWTPMAKIRELWEQAAERSGGLLASLDVVENWPRRRRNRVRALWRDQMPDLSTWQRFLEILTECPELRRRAESTGFVIGFDWALRSSNLIPLFEGGYSWGN